MSKHCEYCRHLQYKDGGYCYLFRTEPDIDFCSHNTAMSEMFATMPQLQLLAVVETAIGGYDKVRYP